MQTARNAAALQIQQRRPARTGGAAARKHGREKAGLGITQPHPSADGSKPLKERLLQATGVSSAHSGMLRGGQLQGRMPRLQISREPGSDQSDHISVSHFTGSISVSSCHPHDERDGQTSAPCGAQKVGRLNPCGPAHPPSPLTWWESLEHVGTSPRSRAHPKCKISRLFPQECLFPMTAPAFQLLANNPKIIHR